MKIDSTQLCVGESTYLLDIDSHGANKYSNENKEDNCFSSMSGSHKFGGCPLVNWSRVAAPKKMGGWEFKNIFLVYESLPTRSLWRLTRNDSLWERVMESRYM